jgi:hypothetical protein
MHSRSFLWSLFVTSFSRTKFVLLLSFHYCTHFALSSFQQHVRSKSQKSPFSVFSHYPMYFSKAYNVPLQRDFRDCSRHLQRYFLSFHSSFYLANLRITSLIQIKSCSIVLSNILSKTQTIISYSLYGDTSAFAYYVRASKLNTNAASL